LGRSIHATKKNTEALFFASKETGLEVNAKKTKYTLTVMPPDQHAGQNHNIKIDKKSFERVEQFRYFETTVAKQNSIREEIKSRLKSGNVCYHSVQNLLSSSLLSKNIRIKVYRTLTLLVGL
jgi:hypothetical protein